MKIAYNEFVDAFLPNTPTQIAVVEFDTTAHTVYDYSDDPDAIKNAINAADSGGYTNWQDALSEAYDLYDNRVDKPDLFIFASDGNPNRYGPSGIGNSVLALSTAIEKANTIKQAGIRIITLGIGNDLDADNLKAISSEDAYYDTDFSTLADTLAGLAEELCGGTITVKKYFDDEVYTEGWPFTTSVINGTPETDTKTTGDEGMANFEIEISDGEANVSILDGLEEMVGYYLDEVDCVKNNEPIEVTVDGKTVSGITVGTSDIIFCEFYNNMVVGPYCGDNEINQTEEECDDGP